MSTILDETAAADDGPGISPCDPYAQDCDDNEKCSPYSIGGAQLDAVGCFAIPPDGHGLGVACTEAAEPTTGADSCDRGLVCTSTNGQVPKVCEPMCQGSVVAPLCDDPLSCASHFGGLFGVCIAPCNPLTDDCGTLACYVKDDVGVCHNEGTGLEGMPCVAFNDCVEGYACVTGGASDTCIESPCCSAYCNIEQPVCPPTALCVSLWPPQTAPEGYSNLGVCTVALP